MCGIIGVLSRQQDSRIKLEQGVKLLHHRGPDDQGIWSDRYVTLGHTRLSILDLSPLGHQPMSYAEGRFWITFNGEIYNYLELRENLMGLGYQFKSQTDTEVILAAYVQWGKYCLEKLRGMFAFAIWEKDHQTLFLSRDRLGEKPLYYFWDQENFYFASELKALLALLPKRPELDPISIDLYFHYQYVPEPRTPLVGIHKLPAAHYLLISPQQWDLELKSYWSLAQIEPIKDDPVEVIRSELDRVIELTLRSDVPVGIALSGGIDSSAIAALASSKYQNTLQSFSIGYPGYPPYDERREAQGLAKTLGLPFNELELHTQDLVNFFPHLVSAIDEPIADIAAYGHYSVMKLAADHGVKVMLSGIGGDELFWGYPWLRDATRLTQTKQKLLSYSFLSQWTWETFEQFTEHPFYKKFLYSSKVPPQIQSLFKAVFELGKLNLQYPQQAVYQNLVVDFPLAVSYTHKIYTSEFREQLPARNPYHIFDLSPQAWQDIPISICQLMFETWLVSNCLSLGDRVSMVSGVETRLPLVDYHLVEQVIGLRKAHNDHQFEGKFWLKAALKDVLDPTILQRPKRGFQPPFEEWIKAILEEYLDSLIDGNLMGLKILDRNFIKQNIHQLQEHPLKLLMLYKLLFLETWYREILIV